MKKALAVPFIIAGMMVIGSHGGIQAQEAKQRDSFFLSGLHSSARGMAYWYDKANGGLETLTDVPYSKLGCQNCHVPSCDACHKTEVEGKTVYSAQAARNQEVCLKCHAREASIMKIDKSGNQEDIHFAKGMQCMDCHSAREMHGDGTEYSSMKQPGAMDTRCEKCHDPVKPSVSHTVHAVKLDCKACHERHVVSCTSCHFETLFKEGKRVAVPVFGWVFLMNYGGQVTSANMQTFVVPGNKTFLMFAPQHSHSIMKEGRKCDDCHGTETVRQIQKGRLSLTWLEKGEVKQVKGVIPVVDGVTYDAVYQNYREGKWIPIDNPPKPGLHYAGFGKPLTQEQLNRLAERRTEK
jgi:hypothetical protein